MKSIDIERLLDRVVSASLSSNSDAGWHQTTLMQKLIMFQGDLPRTTGMGSGHDEQMIRELRWVTRPSEKMKEALRLFNRLTQEQRLAAYVWARFRKTYNAETSKMWTEKEMAALVGMTQNVFHNHKGRAVKRLKSLLEETRLKNDTE